MTKFFIIFDLRVATIKFHIAMMIGGFDLIPEI